MAISLMLEALFFFTFAVDLEQLEAEAQHSFFAAVFTVAFSQDLAHFSPADAETEAARATATERSNECFIDDMIG